MKSRGVQSEAAIIEVGAGHAEQGTRPLPGGGGVGKAVG